LLRQGGRSGAYCRSSGARSTTSHRQGVDRNCRDLHNLVSFGDFDEVTHCKNRTVCDVHSSGHISVTIGVSVGGNNSTSGIRSSERLLRQGGRSGTYCRSSGARSTTSHRQGVGRNCCDLHDLVSFGDFDEVTYCKNRTVCDVHGSGDISVTIGVGVGGNSSTTCRRNIKIRAAACILISHVAAARGNSEFLQVLAIRATVRAVPVHERGLTAV
jgi:hypothetical protein